MNFRAGLIRALVAARHEVVAVAPPDKYVFVLGELGCRYVPLPMDNGGTRPVHDLLLLWRFGRLLQQERPDVYLGFTVKPNVYGSLAAHWLGIPVINNVAGLGAAFGKNGMLVQLVRRLYRLALGRSAKVFFQNDDDKRLLVEGGLVRPEIADLLPGSGIDLSRFLVVPLPCADDVSQEFRFLMVGRMLWEKGVGEYVEAAKVLKTRWPAMQCCLLGFLDVDNPGAISSAQMDLLVQQGVVYLGTSDDVRVQIAQADCVVLPSYYREGTPRTLLEAAAMGRPIVTTDAVGCREVVDDGVNGYLCKVRDARDLAYTMERILLMTAAQRTAMGLAGRAKMEKEFDEQLVINKYLAAIGKAVREAS